MSDSLNDVYVDIPFITERINERNLSKAESSVVSSWCTESRNHSDSPSPSSSFRDDGALLTRKHTVPFVFVSVQPYHTSSLDDVRGTTNYCGCRGISRNNYGRRSQYSEFTGSSTAGSNRRKSSTPSEGRRSSVRSSVRSNKSRRSIYGLERNRSIRSAYSRRASTNIPPTTTKTEDDLKRERRHQIAVWLVLGSFIFIAISSILVVIITLTHQSEHNSLVYYTFSPPSNISLG